MSDILLQSKLNRLKISCKKEGNKIIIGKPKTDKTILFGLVIFPLFAAISGLTLMINNGYLYGKAVILIIGLVIFAIFNFGRIGKKLGQNNTIKILENNCIKIIEKKEIKRFDTSNIIDIIYEIKENKLSNEIVYMGTILLKDTNDNFYQILGFDDEDEKLLKNDLEWISNYFLDYIKLQS